MVELQFAIILHTKKNFRFTDDQSYNIRHKINSLGHSTKIYANILHINGKVSNAPGSLSRLRIHNHNIRCCYRKKLIYLSVAWIKPGNKSIRSPLYKKMSVRERDVYASTLNCDEFSFLKSLQIFN